MNVASLMAKTATAPTPIVGATYLTKNWDGGMEPVRVVAVRGDEMVMEYDDGVRHRISVLYFWEGIEALLAQ